MRIFFTLLLPILLAVSTVPSTALALERHIHARAGGSSAQQLPLIVAKDLGLFEKYGLDVDLLEIRGGWMLMAISNRQDICRGRSRRRDAGSRDGSARRRSNSLLIGLPPR